MDATQIIELIRLSGLVTALFVFLGTWLVARLVTEGAERLQAAFGAQRLLVGQVASFARFTIYVVGSVVAFQSVFSMSKEILTVVGGTIVVTVGLVLKDQASSVLAGIMLLVEKPFQVGDRVSFGQYYGTIRDIGLRSVRLITLDDNEVTIPNSSFLSSAVASGNSGELTMMVQQDLLVGPDQDLTRARQIVEECLTSSPYFYPDKAWTVLVNQISLGNMVAVRLRAKAYVVELQHEKAFESDVAQRVLEAFREEGIRPPSMILEGSSGSEVGSASAPGVGRSPISDPGPP